MHLRNILPPSIFTCLLIFSLPSHSAAVFTDTIILDDTAIINNGVLVEANNLGLAAQSVNVNGVAFGTDSSGTAGTTNAGVGDFSTDAFSSELDALLSSLVFSTTTTNGALTIDGLTIGTSYRLQLLFSNDLNTTGNNVQVGVEGSSYDLTNWQPTARNLIVDFIASDIFVTTTFQGLTNDNTGQAVLNGYAIHDVSSVPVPAAAWLFGSGLLGLIAIARKRLK